MTLTPCQFKNKLIKSPKKSCLPGLPLTGTVTGLEGSSVGTGTVRKPMQRLPLEALLQLLFDNRQQKGISHLPKLAGYRGQFLQLGSYFSTC